MEAVRVSEITKLKQRVHALEQELELQKRIMEDPDKRQGGSFDSENRADCDIRIEEEVERRTRDLRVALDLAEKDRRRKGEFLANISHDILTPMDGILGMTGLVLETELTQEQRQYLEMVSASADRLLGVLNDILDYSQIEAGKLRLTLEDFDLFDLLECDLYILKLAAEHKKIDLLHYIEPGIPQNVRSDPERLRQVLVNLVNNAIKFTDTGLVTVDVTTIGYDTNLILKFSVTDTGIGIPYEKQNGIFHSLGSAGGGFDHKHSGAGLGLAVSAKLVALAGGEIGLESEPGEGATFWFTWPVTVSAENERHLPGKTVDEADENSFVLKGANVLLAEDEPISGALTEKLLQQVGVQVTMVENGKKAVEETEKGGYQVVLMDVQMPVMAGLTAPQVIRARARQRGGGGRGEDTGLEETRHRAAACPSNRQAPPGMAPVSHNHTRKNRIKDTCSYCSFSSCSFSLNCSFDTGRLIKSSMPISSPTGTPSPIMVARRPEYSSSLLIARAVSIPSVWEGTSMIIRSKFDKEAS